MIKIIDLSYKSRRGLEGLQNRIPTLKDALYYENLRTKTSVHVATVSFKHRKITIICEIFVLTKHPWRHGVGSITFIASKLLAYRHQINESSVCCTFSSSGALI